MRKVLFKKWVEGIELETTKGKSCQTWKRDYKQGTNCWTDFVHEGYFHNFMYNFGPHGEPYANIEHNGEMFYVEADKIRFIDTPESEQRAEFAKAAMQGILSNPDWVKSANIADDFDEFKERVAMAAIEISEGIINKLKKQKS